MRAYHEDTVNLNNRDVRVAINMVVRLSLIGLFIDSIVQVVAMMLIIRNIIIYSFQFSEPSIHS